MTFPTLVAPPFQRYPNQTNQRICLAEFQLWTDLYIDDLGVACGNFVTVTESGAKAVPMSVAAAAYGQPTLAFSGGASDFTVNGGTGGSFTQTGTVTDFTPGP